MNDDLIWRVTKEKVQAALFDMGTHSVLGSDGFALIFYQIFWEDCKYDIMQDHSLIWVFWISGTTILTSVLFQRFILLLV